MRHPSRLFFVANTMLLGNLAAVAVSLAVTILLYERSTPAEALILEVGWKQGQVVDWLCFTLIAVLTLLYESPIRRALADLRRSRPVDPVLWQRARQRVLNEPFFLITLDAALWCSAAGAYGILLLEAGLKPAGVLFEIVLTLIDGLITVTAAFFLLQAALQKILVPVFFPQGDIWEVPGVRHLRLGPRLMALTFAVSIIPLADIAAYHLAAQWAVHEISDPQVLLTTLNRRVHRETAVFMASAVVMTFLLAGNLRRPLQEMIAVLRLVPQGIFDRKVRVVSNDELGYAAEVINTMTRGLKDRDMIKDTFGKYVAAEIRDEVLAGRVPLDGERKEVSVLFADLRDFTALTESHDPKLVIRLMNEYFGAMAAAVRAQGGLILQFLGDEIYAVFGAPLPKPDHPERAVRAGLEMNRRLEELNALLEGRGWPRLRHGIGIHSGSAVAAAIGSPDRLSYLLVGDTVNLASRLQELTKSLGAGMIVSADTHGRLEDPRLREMGFRPFPALRIRGKSLLVDCYALLEDEGGA